MYFRKDFTISNHNKSYGQYCCTKTFQGAEGYVCVTYVISGYCADMDNSEVRTLPHHLYICDESSARQQC